MIWEIQQRGVVYVVNANIKIPENVVKGIVHKLEPEMTNKDLMSKITPEGRYTVIDARMLGKSSLALICFERPHVPFRIKVGGAIL